MRIEDNLCDGCIFDYKKCDEKPCSTCIQWVEGYLTATNYESNFGRNDK